MATIVPVNMKAPLEPTWLDKDGKVTTVESVAWSSSDPDVTFEITPDTQTAVAVPADTTIPGKTVQVTAVADPHFGDGTGNGPVTIMAELTIVGLEAVSGSLNVGVLIPK